MAIIVNVQLVRLALGCIQPADAVSISKFLGASLVGDDTLLSPSVIQTVFDGWIADGDVVSVHKKNQLYSLTRQGDKKLNPKERKVRDRTRLFLLKNLRADKLHLPEAGAPEKADVSSAVIVDLPLQEDERPTGAVCPPRVARRADRACWPLLAKQLFVGSSSRASGPFFRFLSFPTIKACAQANGLDSIPSDGIGLNEISLALGISPQLIGLLIHKPERHYRTFQIPKSNGGTRNIQSPRTMMKVAQYFLLDYVLYRCPIHVSAMAYSRGCTVRNNAEVHVGRRFVANIDVENFFPSLSRKIVLRELMASGMEPATANLVSRIASYEGGLPQGAPTSAALSNIALFRIDDKIFKHCQSIGVEYTRYADDITFSGESLEAIQDTIEITKVLLNSIGLMINKSKTRVFGPSSRKVVTGVVVNEWAQPSRKSRRKLRAELHQATLNPEKYASQIDVIRGKAAYMLSYAGEGRPVGGLSKGYVESSLAKLAAYIKAHKG
ncbi:reverse transcriptase domain-containing protein [Pseudomonas sp. A-B-26]|uniref:reverse transcriptase domain-containing protein n=1 Tax=Pseudomonas sp. A-B-26 TaxID=2832406 RepID=UPI001CBA823D|nr:reverse transcriptase domain-containing protein [Pseudomonas sp. A-B-26]